MTLETDDSTDTDAGPAATGGDAGEPATWPEQLLPHILRNVVFDGWTDGVLRRAAEACGLPPVAASVAFPGGPRDAVVRFSRWADDAMIASVAAQDLIDQRMSDRIEAAVKGRLLALQPFREAANQAFAFLLLPQNAALGARLLAETIDSVWYAAGDQSTDFAYYTKRATLAPILSATTLYWLQDTSPESANTFAFLRRRLEGWASVQRAGRQLAGLQRFGIMMPSPTRFFRLVRRRAEPSLDRLSARMGA